jgi:hypothetical protein
MTNNAILTDYGTGPFTQQAHFDSVRTVDSCSSVFTVNNPLIASPIL